MSLSTRSVENLAATLAVDFNEFLCTEYGLALNEVLADAANNFLQENLGELDDELFYDLALALMDRAQLS